MNKIIIIMAGGLGKRMNSNIPKVLHKINNVPMICHLLKTALKTNPTKILIVVGIFKNEIQCEINKYISDTNRIVYIDQQNPMGTGHAIHCTLPELKKHENSQVLILSGDTPLVSENTMKNLLSFDKCVAMVTTYKDNNSTFVDYGKAICDDNVILEIVEKKDCNEEQLKINTVNCGIYSFPSEVLIKCIPLITNHNSQNEYYLTDIVKIANVFYIKTHTYKLKNENQYEIIGVNTQQQLHDLTITYNDFLL